MQQHGAELLRVSHHNSSCDICKEWDGRTFSMPDAPLEIKSLYPEIDELPPFHPNCKHSIGPAAATFDNLMADLEAKYGGELTEHV